MSMHVDHEGRVIVIGDRTPVQQDARPSTAPCAARILSRICAESGQADMRASRVAPGGERLSERGGVGRSRVAVAQPWLGRDATRERVVVGVDANDLYENVDGEDSSDDTVTTRGENAARATHCFGGGAASSGGGCHAGERDGWCECACDVCGGAA